jgi:hypothetical protein
VGLAEPVREIVAAALKLAVLDAERHLL